jgi:hypothetical protein
LNDLRGSGSSITTNPAVAPTPARAAREVSSASLSSSSSSIRERPATAQAPAPAQAENLQPATSNLQPTPADTDLLALWSRLVEAVGRASPFTRTYLLEAHPVSFARNVFTIGFDPEFEDHIGLVDNARNHTLLQTKLSELGHPNAQFKFIKAEAPAGFRQPEVSAAEPAAPAAASVTTPTVATAKAAPPLPKEKTAPVPFNKNDFKNDPLIQKALEIFKGQIVEVRA